VRAGGVVTIHERMILKKDGGVVLEGEIADHDTLLCAMIG
jgi:hypothetical protein